MKNPLTILRITALTIILIAAAASAYAQTEEEDDRITRAGIFLDTGRPDRAAVILYDVINDDLADGEHMRALYVLSEAMRALGRPVEQERYLDEALTLDPAAEYADDVRVAYAQFVLDDGRTRDCVGLAGEFYNSYPDSPLMPDMQTIEAEAWFRGSEYLRAFNTLSDIIEQYPGSDLAREAVMKQGICLYHLDLISGAIERLESYLDESPDGEYPSEAMYYLGMCYERIDRPDLAAPAFRRVTLSHPSYDRVLDAFFRLGRACYDTGQYAEAENAFFNYVANTPESDPDRDESLFYLERIKFRTGEYRSELQIAENFADKYPDSPRTPGLLFDLARYHRTTGNTDGAISVYRRIMDDGRYAAYADSAAWMIADTLDRAGEYDHARTFLLDTAHNSASRETAGNMYLRLGLLAGRRLEYDDAIAWYDSALAADGSSDIAYRALTCIGRTFGILKRWYQAAQTYERIIDEFPGRDGIGEIHAALAEVYYAQGRVSDAAQIAERGTAYLDGPRKTALQFRIADMYEEIDNRRALGLYRSLSEDRDMPRDQHTRALLEYGDLALSLGDSLAANDAYRSVVSEAADSTSVRRAMQALRNIDHRDVYPIE